MIQHLDALLVTSRQIESRKGDNFVLKTNALIMPPSGEHAPKIA